MVQVAVAHDSEAKNDNTGAGLALGTETPAVKLMQHLAAIEWSFEYNRRRYS
jgi:hypothetical protein